MQQPRYQHACGSYRVDGGVELLVTGGYSGVWDLDTTEASHHFDMDAMTCSGEDMCRC